MKSKKAISWIIMLAIVGIFWFIPPIGEEMNPVAFRFLGIFLATVVGFILQPMPMGALAFIATTVIGMLKLVPVATLTAGWGSTTVWLVAAAFMIARGFRKTGLGRRISLLILKAIGRDTLMIGYAITFSELIFGPAVPSFTARSGALIFPIIQGINEVFDSKPGATAKRCGSYFLQLEHQMTTIVACMFLTSSAVNPASTAIIKANTASAIEFTWMQWTIYAIVPGIILVLTVPFIMYLLCKPEIKKTPEARKMATDELAKMGPMSKQERWQLVVFIGCLVLWATSSITKFDTTGVALFAVAVQILTGILTWNDFVSETGAWDTLIWIGTLVVLAGQINTMGISKWFITIVSGAIGTSFSPLVLLIVVLVVYVLTHYFFASTTSHMSAFMLPCLLILVGGGINPVLASLAVLMASNFPGALTHYASGPSPIFFGAGYVDVKEWWRNAAIVGAYNLVVWLVVGGFWWKLLGMQLT